MNFIKILIISIILTFNFCYADDPCGDGKALVNNVISEIVNCKEGRTCSYKRLNQYNQTLAELIEILKKSGAYPSENCVGIIEAFKAIEEYLAEIESQ